jgi:hypothetical protein
MSVYDLSCDTLGDDNYARVELPSGRTVWVVAYFCESTYDGLLLSGRPGEQDNQSFVRLAKNRVEALWNLSPYVKLPKRPAADRIGPMWYPRQRCAALLLSHAVRASRGASMLALLWFGDRVFDLAVRNLLPEVMQDVSWKDHAIDIGVGTLNQATGFRNLPEQLLSEERD